jgi:thymidylate kinase
MDAGTIEFLNEFASHGRHPDMTTFIDISIPTSFQRIAARNNGRDRIELEGESFFENARRCYLRLSGEMARFFAVDGTATIGTIHEKIRNEFVRRFFSDR